MTALDEWSDHSRGFYLKTQTPTRDKRSRERTRDKTLTRDKHPCLPGEFESTYHSNRAAAGPRLRPCGHWDWQLKARRLSGTRIHAPETRNNSEFYWWFSMMPFNVTEHSENVWQHGYMLFLIHCLITPRGTSTSTFYFVSECGSLNFLFSSPSKISRRVFFSSV